MTTTFYSWASKQTRRDDQVGDVARDVCYDPRFPRAATTCPEVFSYFVVAGSSDAFLECAVLAFREMRRKHPLQPPTPRRLRAMTRIAPPSVRAQVLERDGFRCRRCGTGTQFGARLVIDHIHPFSKGGKTKIENLQTLCVECNAGKRDRLPTSHDLAITPPPTLERVPPLDAVPSGLCRACWDDCSFYPAERHRPSSHLTEEATYRCRHGKQWTTYYATSLLVTPDELRQEMDFFSGAAWHASAQ